MSPREPRLPSDDDRMRDGDGADADAWLADFDDFAASLRAELTTVAATPARAAAIRTRAHAELRRASAPPPPPRATWLFIVESSTALAAGAMYVVWTIAQVWPR